MKYLLVCLITISIACTFQVPQNEHKDHSESIDKLYQQFSEAYQTLDTVLVGDLYAGEARYLTGNPEREILGGKEAIRSTFASYFTGAKKNRRNLDISFRIVERKIADSLAYDTGYYLIRSKAIEDDSFPEGGSVGKFVTVMGLQEDGSWKFLLDGFSPAPYKSFLSNIAAHNPAE